MPNQLTIAHEREFELFHAILLIELIQGSTHLRAIENRWQRNHRMIDRADNIIYNIYITHARVHSKIYKFTYPPTYRHYFLVNRSAPPSVHSRANTTSRREKKSR